MFFSSSKAKKRRKLKKLKKKQREEFFRRTHIIIEARKKHMKNKKKAAETLSQGGFASVSSMEDDDLGVKVSMGVDKAIQAGGKVMDKLRKRQKSLSKSRNTHLAKLQAARKQVVARSRT